MDFPQQLQSCVEQANEALRRFIAPQPFQNTPLVEAMQYGALLGGKRLRPFLVYATGDMFGEPRYAGRSRRRRRMHPCLFANARRSSGNGR